MRWIAVLLALVVAGLMVHTSGSRDAGSAAEGVLDALLVRAAGATEFKQRHEALGVACAACHGADLNFSTIPPMAQCLTCHGSYEAVAALTASVIPNPHHSHMGEVTCTDCHSEHQESRLSCNQCHVFDMDVP